MADTGLKYYQADTDRFRDARIRRLMRKYKGTGYAIYEYALNECFAKGYYTNYDEDFVLFASEDLYEEEETVREVMAYCAELGLFDSAMFEKQILTSRSIQTRYVDINTKMRRKVVTGDYWLIGNEDVQNNDVRDANCTKEVCKTAELRKSEVVTTEDCTKTGHNIEIEIKKEKERNISDCLTVCVREGGEDVLTQSEKQINFWLDVLSKDETWIDTVSQEFYPTDSKTRKEELRARLEEFARSKITDRKPVVYTQEHDFIEHFKRWLRIKLKIEKQESNKTSYSDGNRNDKRRGIDAGYAQTANYGATF